MAKEHRGKNRDLAKPRDLWQLNEFWKDESISSVTEPSLLNLIGLRPEDVATYVVKRATTDLQGGNDYHVTIYNGQTNTNRPHDSSLDNARANWTNLIWLR